jgi:hypothetical protein
MTAGNHDISAAVSGGRIYVAGGLTEHWGSPPRRHAFDEIWEFQPGAAAWSTVARLSSPRIYCGTVAFADEIWVLGGDTVDPNEVRQASSRVEIFAPASRTLRPGPDLPVAQPAPLALALQDRLYVVGAGDRESPGRMDSLGTGESAWRREPDGPAAMWALAGAADASHLYVCVPGSGLWRYRPATRLWQALGGPVQPRSPQVARWRDEIWILGGRDLADGRAVWIFAPATGRWRPGPSLPEPLAWGAAAAVDGALYLIGGAWNSSQSPNGFDYSDRIYALRASALT